MFELSVIFEYKIIYDTCIKQRLPLIQINRHIRRGNKE